MAKDKITDYDATAANNLDVGGISVAEGMLPSGVNNSIRELMSHQKEAFGSGTPLYVDQTNNRLGINQAAPSHPLHVGTDDLIVDASGNVLVGKTSASTSTVGSQLNADGLIYSGRDGNEPLILNRLTSDGDIAAFRKDGTTVGSVGARQGDLTIGTGTTGLQFYDSGLEIFPVNISTNTFTDGTVTLGDALVRFKDLYLSGGVYLGGTGSANYLDDYEEGTFGVSAAPQTSGTVTLNASYDTLSYTKVGRVVTINGEVRVSSVSSPSGTRLVLSNLPFAVVNLNDFSGRANGCTYGYISSTVVAQPFRCTESNTQIWLDVDCSTLGSGNEFGFSFSYFTA